MYIYMLVSLHGNGVESYDFTYMKQWNILYLPIKNSKTNKHNHTHTHDHIHPYLNIKCENIFICFLFFPFCCVRTPHFFQLSGRQALHNNFFITIYNSFVYLFTLFSCFVPLTNKWTAH